jgi:hypothetical protein
MCSKSPKAPTPAAPPDPAPVPTPSEISPTGVEGAKQKTLQRIRNGMASTVLNSASGIQQKPTLISTPVMGLKDKLGV